MHPEQLLRGNALRRNASETQRVRDTSGITRDNLSAVAALQRLRSEMASMIMALATGGDDGQRGAPASEGNIARRRSQAS
jgi:hypothetical protein